MSRLGAALDELRAAVFEAYAALAQENGEPGTEQDVMRARSEPVRAFSTKDEAVRFAGRQLGEHYAVYHKDRKIWPIL